MGNARIRSKYGSEMLIVGDDCAIILPEGLKHTLRAIASPSEARKCNVKKFHCKTFKFIHINLCNEDTNYKYLNRMSLSDYN